MTVKTGRRMAIDDRFMTTFLYCAASASGSPSAASAVGAASTRSFGVEAAADEEGAVGGAGEDDVAQLLALAVGHQHLVLRAGAQRRGGQAQHRHRLQAADRRAHEGAAEERLPPSRS